MSLESRHWPSLCIIAVVARSVVVVVVVCADATPVINAVLSNAAAKYFVIIVSSKTVNPTNMLARFWFHRQMTHVHQKRGKRCAKKFAATTAACPSIARFASAEEVGIGVGPVG